MSIQLIRIVLMQQLKLIICSIVCNNKKYNALYNSGYYEYNEMCYNIRYNIDKYCIKREDD